MKAVSGKHFAKVLEQHGWKLVRVSGSHHIHMREGSTARISVPIHANRSLKIGMQRHFMSIAELSESDL